MDDLFSTLWKCIKHWVVTELLVHGNETPLNSLPVTDCLWWRYCGHKYCPSGWEKQWIVVEIFTWMTICGLEDLSPQLVIWRGKELTTYQEDRLIPQRALAEKLCCGLAGVNEILLVWVTKCMCWMDATLACAQYEENKTGRYQSLFACYESEDNDFLHSGQVARVGCVITTQKWKANLLNVIVLLLPEKEYWWFNFLLENLCSLFSKTAETSLARSTWWKVWQLTPTINVKILKLS
jgi:hypothetical protein